MSRGYTYDHAGRVSSGSSDGVASFRQYYSYDELDNLTGRSGTYNWQSGQSDSATYTTDRRDGWTYDADGRLKVSPANSSSNLRNWTYDAAGQLVTTAETAGNTTTTYNATFDGDGQTVYENLTGVNARTDYLIYSTVLGGTVLTLLDSNGNKSLTHVPAMGLVFPQQVGPPYVNWIQRDPTGGTELGSGGYMGMAAYDPLGNFAPLEQHPPANQGPPPPTGMYGTWYGNTSSAFGNGNNYGTGCLLDGVPLIAKM